MKLTRSQKRYAGILGACALALVVDRVFLAPGAAKADANDTSSVVDAVLAQRARNDTTAPARQVVIPHTTIAEQLEAIARERQLDPTDVRDAFHVPPWVDIEVMKDDSRIREFTKKHRLTGVMASGERGYAIVDGKRLRIGETVDGFELVAIEARSIKLVSDRHEVELTLSEPSIQGGG